MLQGNVQIVIKTCLLAKQGVYSPAAIHVDFQPIPLHEPEQLDRRSFGHLTIRHARHLPCTCLMLPTTLCTCIGSIAGRTSPPGSRDADGAGAVTGADAGMPAVCAEGAAPVRTHAPQKMPTVAASVASRSAIFPPRPGARLPLEPRSATVSIGAKGLIGAIAGTDEAASVTAPSGCAVQPSTYPDARSWGERTLSRSSVTRPESTRMRQTPQMPARQPNFGR